MYKGTDVTSCHSRTPSSEGLVPLPPQPKSVWLSLFLGPFSVGPATHHSTLQGPGLSRTTWTQEERKGTRMGLQADFSNAVT